MIKHSMERTQADERDCMDINKAVVRLMFLVKALVC